MSSLIELNWIAIGVSTLISGGLGAAWYSPAFFGSAWMAELGKTQDELGRPGPAIGGSIFSCFIASVSLGILLSTMGIDTLLGGLRIGALIAIGIVAMTMLSDALFSGWSIRLYLIQVGYRALYIILIGCIYGGWPF